MAMRLFSGAAIFLLYSRIAVGLQKDLGLVANRMESMARAQALESYAVLHAATRGLPVNLNHVSGALNDMATYIGILAEGRPPTQVQPKVKPFVILSQQRSGSGFLSTLLDSHRDVTSIRGEAYGNQKFFGSLHEAFAKEMDYVLAKVQNGSSTTKWLGIKVQTNQVQYIKGGLNNKDVTFLFHWRRNALRQIISGASMEQRPSWYESAHALSVTAKLDLAAFVPKVPVAAMECNIASILYNHSLFYEGIANSGAKTCNISHYEDWLMPETRRAAEQSIFDCFEIEAMPLTTPFQEVHTNLPLLQTLGNYEDVKKALAAGPFEYMLEEAPTVEENFANLMRSDSYDREPPPPMNCYWESRR